MELFRRAELPIAADPVASRDIAERAVALAPLRRRLQESRVNASLMRHADGRPHDEVLRWLIEVGRFAPDVAAKRLEFIEHPLWRAYVFVYHEGEALLRDLARRGAAGRSAGPVRAAPAGAALAERDRRRAGGLAGRRAETASAGGSEAGPPTAS